jgi:hypothetical protein
MKERFCENRLRGCGRMFLAFTNKLCKKLGKMCYTTKCDTVENGLTEHASEGNQAGKEVNLMLSCETGNLVVMVDVKENVEE